MDGISIGGQHLYSEEDVQQCQSKVHSILHSKDMDVQYMPNGGIEGESTLNSIEVNFLPQQDGTMIEVDHGISPIGVILGVILMFAFVIGGLVIFLIWYLKYDELKDELKMAFPAYMPPGQGAPGPRSQQPPQNQQSTQYQNPPNQNQPNNTPPPPEED